MPADQRQRLPRVAMETRCERSGRNLQRLRGIAPREAGPQRSRGQACRTGATSSRCLATPCLATRWFDAQSPGCDRATPAPNSISITKLTSRDELESTRDLNSRTKKVLPPAHYNGRNRRDFSFCTASKCRQKSSIILGSLRC